MKALIIYENPAVQKKKIYKDNKNRIGVYVWKNKFTGEKYVGSSLNLSQRFIKYFSISTLKRETLRNNSRIDRAIFKYEIQNFTLEIMEYCDLNIIIEREQFYLDNIKPIYNILAIAGSRVEFKHSEATK